MAKGESLTRVAYEQLREAILTCRAEPGQRMNIGEWSAHLEVSPGAVREALSRLTAEGLVVAEPQRGFRVVAVSVEDLRGLTDARVTVEGIVVRRSVAQGDVRWETRVVAAHHGLSRTPLDEREAWSRAHAELHEAVVAACDNAYLLDIRRGLYAKSERYRRLSAPLARTKRNLPDEHRAITDAVLARDGERAARLLCQHIEATAQILERGLFSQPSLRTTTTARTAAADAR